MMNENIRTNKYYRSSDLGCTTALLAVGFKLESLDKSNPRRVQFCFVENEALLKAVEQYWADTLMVSAKSLNESIKSLKSRLYGE